MVLVDDKKCTRCGICLAEFEGYCMTNTEQLPSIDYAICNQCQKCIALCPQRAISMNHVAPEKIAGPDKISYDELISFLRLRRSTKRFLEKDIPRDIIEKIVSSAKYAPNQNKNIDILIIDDPGLIRTIDSYALKVVKNWYRFVFTFRPLTTFISLFTRSLPVIKKKMVRDLFSKKRIVKENANVLVVAVGNPRVPVTEMSAQYLLGTMILTAVSLDIGCTLMDSLKLSFNQNKAIKRKLGIRKPNKALGVLALGYSAEKIINVPQGYEVDLHWNRMNKKST